MVLLQGRKTTRMNLVPPSPPALLHKNLLHLLSVYLFSVARLLQIRLEIECFFDTTVANEFTTLRRGT